MPALPEGAAFELAPDWACEILSPSTASYDRAGKVPIYARERVEYVWLLEPVLQTFEVFKPDGSSYRLIDVWSGDQVVHGEPFEGLALRLRDLWSA